MDKNRQMLEVLCDRLDRTVWVDAAIRSKPGPGDELELHLRNADDKINVIETRDGKLTCHWASLHGVKELVHWINSGAWEASTPPTKPAEEVFTLETLIDFLTEARDSGREIQFLDDDEWLLSDLAPNIGDCVAHWRLEPLPPREFVIVMDSDECLRVYKADDPYAPKFNKDRMIKVREVQ